MFKVLAVVEIVTKNCKDHSVKYVRQLLSVTHPSGFSRRMIKKVWRPLDGFHWLTVVLQCCVTVGWAARKLSCLYKRL